MATEIEVIARADISDFERKMGAAEDRLQEVAGESKRVTQETAKDAGDAFAAILNMNVKTLPGTRDALSRAARDAGRDSERGNQRTERGNQGAFLGGVIGGAVGFAAGAILNSGPVDTVLGSVLNVFLASISPVLLALLPILQALAPVVTTLAEVAAPALIEVLEALKPAVDSLVAVLPKPPGAVPGEPSGGPQFLPPVGRVFEPSASFEQGVEQVAKAAAVGAGLGFLVGGPGGAVTGAGIGVAAGAGIVIGNEVRRRSDDIVASVEQWFTVGSSEASRLWDNDIGPSSPVNRTAGG